MKSYLLGKFYASVEGWVWKRLIIVLEKVKFEFHQNVFNDNIIRQRLMVGNNRIIK